MQKENPLFKKLKPYIEEYLEELKIPKTVEEYLHELVLLPIKIDGILMGFWGVRYRKSGEMILATVKAFYLRKEFRGRYINRAADDLYRGLENQGVTDLELWNFDKVQKWFERRYKLKPSIYITYGKLSAFKLID